MAQTDRNQQNGSSIDAMLRGLTDRPNVQSTLILSRRDGSIIRATGFDAAEKQNNAGGYQWSATQTKTPVQPEVEVQPGGDGAADGKLQLVEVLASSIFQFVNNAGFLATTLGTTSRQILGAQNTNFASGESENKDGAATEDEIDNKADEDEVQLLRLRTKHQEIIVFPDPNYICCVVQRMGKAGHTDKRR
ncbi:hypothetical protein EDD37DRAFT_646319 [Exophiala viscosa]|uniref:Roadblock/LAMTOR2 domain-containing protein n=1 Tax=Exophiala viscosa TaxID=2486360 RepID=A0AAN6E3H2_9EURO|nr:hypothetical protein EDD36DRAFT_2651 [Exophiala viscosa]KAI1626609.1 hypothetical protein EDD37DRAFT_646319 [Exophiala viscosa]